MAKRSPLHERSQCLNILGLSEGSSEDEVRKAYKKLALQYHPDKNHTEGAKEKFQEIGYAYKYLTEGPSAFETEDHLVPEDILIRIFEEMFFPRYTFGFGSHFPFMFADSDDDEYFYYNGSSDDDDDDYYGLFSGRYSSSGRQYRNAYPEPNRTGQTQNPPSNKRRNKKKRNRNKDYSSTSTRQNTFSRNGEQTGFAQQNTSSSSAKSSDPKVNMDAQYTDDVSSVSKETDARKSTTETDADQMQNSAENVNRPRQNDPMQQKPSKKQKKKLEAEQWRREKEMEKIAAELLEKQEKERQKQEKEQEKQAAKKQEELADADKEKDTMYWFEDTKKSRRGRKNERRQTDSETLIHTEEADSSATSGRTTPSDIGQKFTPLVPTDDPCDAMPKKNQFEPYSRGLYSDGNRQHTQGATSVNNKGFYSSGNHHNTQGATSVNNKGFYSSGDLQHTQGAIPVNNKGLYSSVNHQHTQGATPVYNKGLYSSGNHQHTQGATPVNNKGLYSSGNHQHTEGATPIYNKGFYSSGNHQHTQGSTSANNNNGVYFGGTHQHIQDATSVKNKGLFSSGNQNTQGPTSVNNNKGVYSSGNHQHTQGATSVDNKGLYLSGNQHTQGTPSVNNKTQMPGDFDRRPLDSRVSGKLADFNAGSTPETRQHAKNCNQDNILPMHPGFTVTGLPSKRYGLGSSETDHNQSFKDVNFNMKTSNLQPSKTTSKAAEMRGNMNIHFCNQDLFEAASDQNGGKGDSSSLRGGLTHSKGGNSNVQSNSWYASIGGPAPSFAPGHMTEPYTSDVQQPESRKSEARRGGYVQQQGNRKSETKRGGYVQQPGSRKSETKADGYVNHTFQTVEGSTFNGFDPYEMHEPYFQRSSDGYPFTETLYSQSYRQHHDQPQNQKRHKFSEFNDPGCQNNKYSSTGENFNKQARSKDHSSKPVNTKKTENQSAAPKSQPRNQSNHTGKNKTIDQSVHKSLDSINDVDSEWKNGGKTTTKHSPKPSKPVRKEVDDLDSIDDIDLVYIHSDDKQNDPKKNTHATCISNDSETKLKLSDFGNSSNDFLCRSKLDIPKSIISESIRKYYA